MYACLPNQFKMKLKHPINLCSSSFVHTCTCSFLLLLLILWSVCTFSEPVFLGKYSRSDIIEFIINLMWIYRNKSEVLDLF